MKVFLSGIDHGTSRYAVEGMTKIFLSAVEQGPQKQSVKEISQRSMRIFLSACDTATDKMKELDSIREESPDKPFLWNLMSYYYLRADEPYAEMIRDSSELVEIDSGAHSFQKGKKVSWEEYTHQYADFIKRFDRPNVVGYFEMDVDNIIGYENVLKLRDILLAESGHPEKIIPVWHSNRGIDDFIKMCETHEGQTVAITGFRNEDIKDSQYIMFLKEAWKHGCKMHCLGMTRKDVLDKVPFDYVDSSSWAQSAIYGRVGNRKVSKEFSKTNRTDVFKASYLEAMKMQRHYYDKWRKFENGSKSPVKN